MLGPNLRSAGSLHLDKAKKRATQIKDAVFALDQTPLAALSDLLYAPISRSTSSGKAA